MAPTAAPARNTAGKATLMRPPGKIRLVLADVDGTLVTQEKLLTRAAAAAVRELHDAGIAFAVTSGRPPRGMEMLIDPLALREPIAGFNGGAFVATDLSVIETRSLPAHAAEAALDVVLSAGLDAWVYTADQWLIREQNAPHVSREAWTVKFDATIVPSFTADHLARAVKIVGVSDDLPRVAAAEAAAQQTLGSHASAARSQPYYLDITHPDANKGAVVDRLSELLGIARAEIATIGDMPNDVLMFRRSGFSIAMGNASAEVQAQAHATTDSNEDEGFAKAMRRFILPERAA
jgi:Cof subfamily protein (haloacid dehalogenase superfamily)